MSPTNVAASVRQRLLDQAREDGVDYQVLLTRYVLERLLYRLSRSHGSDRFILKGAYAFLIWQGETHRQTRDLDLLGFGAPDPKKLRRAFQKICRAEVIEDGVSFDPETVSAKAIRDQAEYDGIRVTLTARIGSAILPLQVDVGFGDVVTPEPLDEPFPALLEFPPPEVRVYPRETVVSEKLHGMVRFGIANSRLKDYYDLRYLAKHFSFDGEALSKAIEATFERRDTPLPENTPQALTGVFAQDERKTRQWEAFIRRTRLEEETLSLGQVIEALQRFLMPPLRALHAGRSFADRWVPGGPWNASR